MKMHNLRSAIIERYRTQLAFAAAVGISPTRLNRIINGWLEPTPVERARLAELLGVEIEWVFSKGLRAPRPEVRAIHQGVKILA